MSKKKYSLKYFCFFIKKIFFCRYEELSNISKIFPPYKDYLDVCAAISLIQESYDLNTTDLANGNILMKNVSKMKIYFQYMYIKTHFFSGGIF